MEIKGKETRPFGLWDSPVSPALMSVQLRLSDAQWDSDGETLVWLENRGDLGVLVSRQACEGMKDLTYDRSVRARVGYGGGDFSVSQGQVFFVGDNGRIYRRRLAYGAPQPVSPEVGSAASPVLSPDGNWILYVHSAERKDSLGLVRADGAGWPQRLVWGADFYMQPVWHPDSRRFAWIEWNHPNMPWDGTRLMMASLEGDPPRLSTPQYIAGSTDVPIFQPAFSPDGRWLSYIANDGEWDHLYLMDLTSGECRTLVEGGVLGVPAWGQGMRIYGWGHTSQWISYVLIKEGFYSLWRANLDGGAPQKMGIEEYTVLRQMAVSPTADKITFVASSTKTPERIITWDGKNVTVERRSSPEVIPPVDLPVAEPITWPAPDGASVHGLYYPPTNARFQSQGLPPAIINIHGGPTGQVPAGYNADAAFFTSRGYAVLEVNYRGSTGFGRSYMLALREKWGPVDVEDAVGGAQALVDNGRADPKRLVIKGGSAGGYTVLNALVHYPGFFKAGICLFGVSNLFTLAMDTHKFEERYTDSLVGPLPEAAERYREWSPINYIDKVRDPLAVFQGAIDPVVVPEQSETIVAALRQRNVPHLYRIYEGEGHGFRRPETIRSYYEDVLKFLKQYVLFGG